MPAEENEAFPAPEDPNVSIWRYMDFTKFVSMLANQGLYFCRFSKGEVPGVAILEPVS